MAIGRSGKRRFGRGGFVGGAAAAFAVALIAAPGALAAPAAVDQYTEAPPTGPGGSTAELDTGGSQDQPEPRQDSSPAPAPPPVDTSAPALPSGGAAPATAPTVRQTAKRPERRQGRSDRGQRRAPEPNRKFTTSPVGERDQLPVTGYPVTPFVIVLLALGLAALAVRGGAAVYGRVRGPARNTG